METITLTGSGRAEPGAPGDVAGEVGYGTSSG